VKGGSVPHWRQMRYCSGVSAASFVCTASLITPRLRNPPSVSVRRASR
jgi:hypothetical protein